MMYKKVLAIVSVLCALSGIAIAQEKTLVVLQGAEPTRIDPIFERGGVPTYSVAINIFDALLFRTAEGEYIPNLATSYERPDETTWIFHLRRDVFFHNGDLFTARDVAFTLTKILDPATGSRRLPDLKWIKGVEIIDDYTIKIIADPFPLAELYFSELSIVPSTYYQTIGADNFSRAPVGTGPFKFKSWTPGYEIVLEKYLNYHFGPSNIDKIIFRFVPSPATRVAALQAGEADLITDPPIALLPSLQADPNIKIVALPGTRVIFVGFDTLQTSPLQDARVRQALNYAVDKTAIINKLLFGYAEPTVAMLGKKDLGFPKDLTPYPYDPQTAKALLAAAGYPNGFTVTMDIAPGRYINDLEVAQAIVGYLGEIGVKVELNVLEFGIMNERLFSHTTSPMYFIGWGNYPADAQYVYDFIVRTGGLLRTINDPEIDALLNTARTVVDKQARGNLLAEIARRVYELAPVLDLYKQPVIYACSAKLTWTPRPDEFLYLYDAQKQ